MYVTYDGLFLFINMLVGVISLVIKINNNHKS